MTRYEKEFKKANKLEDYIFALKDNLQIELQLLTKTCWENVRIMV